MSEESKNIPEDWKELSKKSLVRMQYSCCGVNSFVEDDEYVPIVNPSKARPEPAASAEDTK